MLDHESGIPLYLQLKGILKNEIDLDKYKNGSFPTEFALMKTYSLSRGTVRKALSELEKEHLIDRFSGKGTFVNSNRPQKLGLFIGELTDKSGINGLGLSPKQLKGALPALYEFHAEIEVMQAQNRVDSEKLLKRIFSGEIGIKGILMGSYLPVFDWMIGEFKAHKFPYIFMDVPMLKKDMNHVYIDPKKAAEKTMKFLLDSGRKNIGCICLASKNPWLTPRYDGYVSSLKAAGLGAEPSLTVKLEELTEKEAASAMNTLLKKNKGLDAVYTISPTLAKGAIDFLLSKGIRVPEDISVAAVDDFESGDACAVPLTTTNLPSDKATRAAVETLLKIINGDVKTPVQREIEPELIIRASVLIAARPGKK